MEPLSQVLKNLHQYPIAYYRCYTTMMGSAAGGVALSQLMFHYGRADGNTFAKKDEELREETGLSIREMREVKAKLKTLPFIKLHLKGVPPTTVYEIDEEALWKALAQNPNLNGAVPIESNGAVQIKSHGAVQNTRARQRFSDYLKKKELGKELKREEEKRQPSLLSSSEDVVEEKIEFFAMEDIGHNIFHQGGIPTENLTPSKLIDLYNDLTPETHPKVVTRSPKRIASAKKYLAIFPDPAFWRTVFAKVSASDFLQGKIPTPGHKTFRADFEWLLSTGKSTHVENCLKVFEGAYDDTKGGGISDTHGSGLSAIAMLNHYIRKG